MGLEKWNLHPSHVKSILVWWKCVFTSRFKGFHVSKCVLEREIYTPPTWKSTLFWESVFLPHVFHVFGNLFACFLRLFWRCWASFLALLFWKRYKKKWNICCCRLVSSAFWEPFFQMLQQWTREFGCFVEYFDSLLTALTLSTASLQPSLLTVFLWASPVIFWAPLLSATVVESTTHVTASYQATLSLLCL